MPRSMVGLLAAIAVALPALVSLAHGYLFAVMVGDAALAAGLVAYVSAPGLPTRRSKKASPNGASIGGLTMARRRRNTPKRRDFVVTVTEPADDHCSSVGEALEAISRTTVRQALDALGGTSVRDALDGLR
jgi:hypothetical protein